MLTIPILRKDGALCLDAFSYSVDELNAVSAVLKAHKIPFEIEQISADDMGRTGRRHIIGPKDVSRVEEILSVKFEGTGEQTTVAIGDLGKGHRCEQLVRSGMGNGCVNFAADDQAAAIVRCSLIARSRSWLGGVASCGNCQNPTSGSSSGSFLGRIASKFRRLGGG